MGLGGYLTWTAVARELCQKIPGTKVFPFEQHGNFIKPIKSKIFYNNPNFYQEITEEPTFCFPLQLNNPETNYCKKDTAERAHHRYDRHIIEQICEVYGIQSPKLQCEIFLDEKEKNKINTLLDESEIEGNFLTIDPSCNKEYTVNKFDQFHKWQQVVNDLKKEIQIVQIGPANVRVLDNVVNLTGQTTFRQAAGIVGKSSIFLGSEGGLVHAATAFDTSCVVVTTGFMHPNLSRYPDHKIVWANNDHGPCGMKIYCNECDRASKNLDYSIIVENIRELLEETS